MESQPYEVVLQASYAILFFHSVSHWWTPAFWGGMSALQVLAYILQDLFKAVSASRQITLAP